MASKDRFSVDLHASSDAFHFAVGTDARKLADRVSEEAARDVDARLRRDGVICGEHVIDRRPARSDRPPPLRPDTSNEPVRNPAYHRAMWALDNALEKEGRLAQGYGS